MKQIPATIGVYLCEQVIIEEATKNVTLVNCFTRREMRQFPSEPFPIVVFATLTDGLGVLDLEVILQRLDTLEEILRRAVTIRFTDPLHQGRLRLRVRDFSVPVAGYYAASIKIDGELIAQRRFLISQKEET